MSARMSNCKYAEIIINNKCKETDRLYHYAVPDALQDRITTGSRVIVPFGIGNKPTEGYVLGLTDSIDIEIKRIKMIRDAVDEAPALSPQMVELAVWMRDKYLCFYLDAIQAIVPTAIRTKSSDVLELDDSAGSQSKIKQISSKLMLDIIEFMEDNDGKTGLTELKNYFAGTSLDSSIKKLIDMGILTKTHVIKNKMSEKVEKTFYINDNAMLPVGGNAKKQAAILQTIKENPGITLKRLKEIHIDCLPFINKLLAKQAINMVEIDDFRVINHKIYKENRHKLTAQQEQAIKNIKAFFEQNKQVVLHGVTGSGKTEIYLEIMEAQLALGKDAIMLVPEIALTPQMISRVKNRFGENVAVLHSNLSEGEKYDEWRKVKQGLVKVVVGARSAVFAPFSNLGVIIIDEEHENTYKSDIKPKYLAREVAEKRCALEGAHLILGSATPQLETYYRTQIGELGLVELLERVNGRPMPEVQLVDMREELKNGNKTIFSSLLTEEILKTLKDKNQLILFLNRRGHSTFVSCRDCGLVMKCPRCSISLTYHMKNNKLSCHYCGFERDNPSSCPKCTSKNIRYFGVGTQKVEQAFQKTFSIKNTLRMDADTTGRKHSHEKILDQYRNKLSNVLLGTQMISKGLDFPDVTLVGVIAADTSLNMPDFRSGEKTFQMIAQVAGRSGRGEKPGKVVVQTYSPEHYSIQLAQKHDYKGFYHQEIRLREQFEYPPFSKMANVIISGLNEQKVIKHANAVGAYLDSEIEKYKRNAPDEIEKLGPISAALSKIKNKYRWQIVLKSKNEENLKTLLKAMLASNALNSEEANISIDLNPQNML